MAQVCPDRLSCTQLYAQMHVLTKGLDDVANAWATSVSSRSITYRQAIVFAFIFEVLGAVTVGA